MHSPVRSEVGPPYPFHGVIGKEELFMGIEGNCPKTGHQGPLDHEGVRYQGHLGQVDLPGKKYKKF